MNNSDFPNSNICHNGTPDFRYQCDLCPETFKYFSQRKQHIQEVHGPGGPLPKDAKLCVCTICGAQLKNDITLKLHIKRNHPVQKVLHVYFFGHYEFSRDDFFVKSRYSLGRKKEKIGSQGHVSNSTYLHE